jgi:two-component system OmpR family response regulator
MSAPLRLVSVVEPEDTLRESVCRALRLDDLRAEGHATPAAARDATQRTLPDLAVVNVDAAGGADLCRDLRSRSATLPIIAVTRRNADIQSLIDSELPADDFLPKPFSLRELQARVKVLLRRASLTGAETLAWEDRPLTLGPLTVDPLRMTAQWGGRDLALTVTEFFMLHSLVRRAGVVKTRDQLLQDAFPGRSADDGLVEGHMVRIRRRIERLEPDFDALEGVHGAGYRYRAGPSVKRR